MTFFDNAAPKSVVPASVIDLMIFVSASAPSGEDCVINPGTMLLIIPVISL